MTAADPIRSKRQKSACHGGPSTYDDPVSGEPVSGSNSLLTGNLTGNFSNLGLFLRFSLLIILAISNACSKIP